MPRRYESLDGLRGISAIAVVLFYITWSNHITETHLIRESYVFVDLFFILSGFVSTRAYSTRVHTLREAGSFLTLRFFRIYPLATIRNDGRRDWGTGHTGNIVRP